MAQEKTPEQTVTLGRGSGHKLVESWINFVNCNVAVGQYVILCFTHATLYLGSA